MTPAAGTLARVPKHEDLPPEIVEHVGKFVDDLIARSFTTRAGKAWPERKIADAIGIAQPTLNKLRNRAGFGVRTLLRLRDYSGQSVDAILGLALPEREQTNVAQLDKLQEQVDALIAVVQTQATKQPGPHSKAGKALESLRRARERAVGQRHLDEKARQTNERPSERKGVA